MDHVWIRVRSVAASKRFYETIAPHAGFRIGLTRPSAPCSSATPGSFSVLTGDQPTENLHMAFPASEDQAVDAFHRAAVEAGYTGQRPARRAPPTTPATTAPTC